MGRRTRLLVIGDEAQCAALARALPDCDVFHAANPLDGVWQGGRQKFDRAYVSLGAGARTLRAVSSLRQLVPELRIVVGCRPADEPIARRALSQGADDYVLEPLQAEDVARAFGVAPTTGFPLLPPAPAPSAEELVRLSEILRNLGDGPAATLDRLALLVRDVFDATGVVAQLDDLSCTLGETTALVLEEPIRRHDRPVGRLALARRARGTYPAAAAVRLAEYARLSEALIDQARQRQRWQELAWTDDLSGLHNRRYFERALEQALARATEKRLRLTVLLFDIDDFKSYNDRYGHETGDKLIREVGLLLRRCTREQDVVARYGGDEFAVVFWDAEKQRVPGSEHPREPIQLASRFCKAIARHSFECLGSAAPGPLTISGGLACFPWNGRTPEALVAAADAALLTAKRTGKNRIHLAGKPEAEASAPR